MRYIKKVVAVLLAVALFCGILPTVNIPVQAADDSISVVFSAGVNDEGFLITPQYLTVSDGISEEYGYTSSIEGVSALDVLVAAHVQYYGEQFTEETAEDYLQMSGSYLTKAFGESASATGFAINGECPNDGVMTSYGYTGLGWNQAPVDENDVLELFWYADLLYYLDNYSWFDERQTAVYVDAPLTLNLQGYCFAWYGCYDQETIDLMTGPISGAEIYVASESDMAFSEAQLSTDDNGNVTLTFDTPGVYYVTAIGTDDTETPFVSPWCKVEVKQTVDLDTQLSSYWSSVFKNSDNQSIVDAKTPTQSVSTGLKWMTDSLSSWRNYGSTPIVVDDFLVATTSDCLVKINKETGEIEQSVSLPIANGYLCVSPLYADGMIFVGLNGGGVAAYNAQTFELLWTYTQTGEPAQSVTPLAYHDGYLYTGFYIYNDSSSDLKEASYVCLDVSPEADGVKEATWTFSNSGGFYWAGAYVNDQAVVFGMEANEEGNSKVVSLDPATGAVLSEVEVSGSVRTSVAHDPQSDLLYVASNDGTLYKLSLNEEGVLSMEGSLALGGATTSTPVVYNGRAYLGVSGPYAFEAQGHKVCVVDTVSMQMIYEVEMPGYPQCNLLLSTAGEEQDKTVSLYATSNTMPGGITVIRDSEGQTEANSELLFVPPAEAQQYCVGSVICDEDGVLYYRNDSGRIFAVTACEAGDVNMDGMVNAEDALLVLQNAAQLKTLETQESARGDLTQDGILSADDALQILRKAAQLD